MLVHGTGERRGTHERPTTHAVETTCSGTAEIVAVHLRMMTAASALMMLDLLLQLLML